MDAAHHAAGVAHRGREYALNGLWQSISARYDLTNRLMTGGRVICLEISKPPKNLLRPFFLFFFNRIVPFAGGLISGQRDAYTYLPQSVNEFLTPDELKTIMERSGLHEVKYRRLMMSTVAIHVGIK